ncbi:hypothetical protein MUK42_30786 [Musa troglodytarum]|nr:hypothetical protein MUK42_30786 [Musa troglodytarum]
MTSGATVHPMPPPKAATRLLKRSSSRRARAPPAPPPPNLGGASVTPSCRGRRGWRDTRLTLWRGR